jgi:16S rRNA (cytidine1402-2'-O)-methyltransferase
VAEQAEAVSTEHLLRTLMAELPLKQAVALTAQVTGGSRNMLYGQALVWRQQAAQGEEGSEGQASPETAESRGKAVPIALPPTRLPGRSGRPRR